MDIIEKALSTAYEAHKGQARKITDCPYFVHILDVAKYLMYETKNETVIVAGILHDTLEDTAYSETDLLNDFGPDVLELVRFCTEPGNTPDASDAEQKASWKQRKTHSIQNIKNGTEEQLLIFLADKHANLSSIKEDLINGTDVWSEFNAPKDEIEWYYTSIRDEMTNKLSGTRLYRIFDALVKEVFK
ncbi:MAG: bifunctional (p)ppGpp synthetase/guanosine-3',5'-bis(diphosphate) 3'-pyrophosphohydrolase [Candidatus Diapherotrites archaeon]|nr:bifunctional (p)ppGpp synthetase/guanosine-3',5'-bis(diphosphate) 3'-pyrophosphohydrolase [Candidatus Diapherotrites archaeon]